MGLVRGICYDGWPAPYNPSTANNSYIFFGSDAANNLMTLLWGSRFTGANGQDIIPCRGDLYTMRDMGVEVIRLYDWEPRKSHLTFLNECHAAGIAVLVSVSNWNLLGGYDARPQQIPALIKSYANSAGSDYHPAVAGVIIGNEPRVSGYTYTQCVGFTNSYVQIEAQQFPGFRKIRIGHPVDFNPYGGRYPCFGFWDPLLAGLQAIRSRLFLAPQSYNDRFYLFQNAEGSGKGWVDLAWEKYQVPIWFTEIGLDRLKANYATFVTGQLTGVRDYSAAHPDRLIGACFFQFLDKVWMQGTSEGSYGAFQHTGTIAGRASYLPDDFPVYKQQGWPHGPFDPGKEWLDMERLKETPLYKTVKSVYKP
jgi:hypothetical protein